MYKHAHALAYPSLQQAVQELQQRIQSVRERTLAVMKEKDAELEQLRQDLLVMEKQRHSQLPVLQSLPLFHRLSSVKSVSEAEGGDDKKQSLAVGQEGGSAEVSEHERMFLPNCPLCSSSYNLFSISTLIC